MNRLAVSLPEAAAALGISASHARRQARAGKIPVVRFGARMVVPVAELERLLKVGARPPARGGGR